MELDFGCVWFIGKIVDVYFKCGDMECVMVVFENVLCMLGRWIL